MLVDPFNIAHRISLVAIPGVMRGAICVPITLCGPAVRRTWELDEDSLMQPSARSSLPPAPRICYVMYD